MAVGYLVTKGQLDQKIGEVVVNLRESLRQANVIDDFLALHPENAPDGDMLTKSEEEGGFGYTADEAYAVRVLFQGITSLNVAQLDELGKKFTGLQ